MQNTEPFIVDNYIVRIYRRDEEDLRKIVGIVEQVGAEEKRSFHSLDELWTILSVAKGRIPRKGKSRKVKGNSG
ncbi:MAG TPA: hypothetical protein DDX84_07290 [Nitrospiraceae bacterium]|nr:hypothetical protein [Nitrospiraceae bacterium]